MTTPSTLRRGGRRTSPAATSRSFLPIYSVLQSNLQKSNKPYFQRRQRQFFGLYAAWASASGLAALALPIAAELRAVLTGLAVPGAGFLQWASDGQAGYALSLMAATWALFGAGLLLWFATGNIVAPFLAWIASAGAAAFPRSIWIDPAPHAPEWLGAVPILTAAAALACALRPLHAGQPLPLRPAFPRAAQPAVEPLSADLAGRLRLLLDRALQSAERFEGFEWRDQFQTAAVRYQINFLSYAIAMARAKAAPAADACFAEAQARLIAKLGDRRIWRYWGLENAWGNLRLDADPVPHQNIMYSGFGALQMALGGQDRLALHRDGREWKSWQLADIADTLAGQYRRSPYGLLACEPNWIYPLCNLITMAGLRAADHRTGSHHWDDLGAPFLASIEREATRADGSFIAFRSALTGLAPPAPGGIVMQAFPCLFLNSLSPTLAEEHWHRVRQRLDRDDWHRLFWPIDVGNYGFSRAAGYAATAAAAAEMGDAEVVAACLVRLDAECPVQASEGAMHRRNASLWAHALELMARCGGRDALRSLIDEPAGNGGPRLRAAPYPDVIVAMATSEGRTLRLMLEPGVPDAHPLLEFAGLLPDRHYFTGDPACPYLKADSDGRGTLRLALAERKTLTIEPVV